MFWQKIGYSVSDRLFRDSVRDSVKISASTCTSIRPLYYTAPKINTVNMKIKTAKINYACQPNAE